LNTSNELTDTKHITSLNDTLFDSLAALGTLTTFDFSIGPHHLISLDILAKNLPRLKHLQHLNIVVKSPQEESWSQFCEALGKTNTLKTFNIRFDDPFPSQKGIDALGTALLAL